MKNYFDAEISLENKKNNNTKTKYQTTRTFCVGVATFLASPIDQI